MSVVSKEILVWREKGSPLTLKQTQHRIELLFGVVLNFLVSSTATSNIIARGGDSAELRAYEWIRVCGPTEDACLKTQKYVLAACSPEYSKVVPCGPKFTHLLFEESPKLRDAIEREFQTVLLPSSEGVLIQGSQAAVNATIKKLQNLKDTVSNHSNQSRGGSSSLVTSTGGTSSPPDIDEQLKKLLTSENIENISDSLKQALLVGIQKGKLKEMTKNEAKDRTETMLSSSPQRQKRTRQFVDLGFPLDKVETVFDSLGDEASDNDIMARLISTHTSKERQPQTLRIPPKPTTEPAMNTPASMREGLRPIVIDGSNVAMSHGNGAVFSCRGIHLAVDWFIQRGHTDITVFVPMWRKEPSKPETPITDQEILFDLAKAELVNFTPSRRIGNKKIVCYDDRYIVRLAAQKGGVIVSNDHFRDLVEENPSWRDAIENRLLMYTFVGDNFMPPTDPLGKHGPHIDTFLQFERGKTPVSDTNYVQAIPRDKQPCPYKERCTFGPRCRFYHPEREQKTREKELQNEQESRDSSPAGIGSPSHERREDLATYSPPRPYTQPVLPHMDTHHDRLGGLGQRYTHPLVHPVDPAYTNRLEYTGSFRNQEWSGRVRDDRPPPSGTIARGSDRAYMDPIEGVGYHSTQEPHLPVPTSTPYLTFSRGHSHPTHRQQHPAHQYYPDHYIADPTHHLSSLPGPESEPLSRRGFPPMTHSSRPHSAHLTGYPPGHMHHYYDQQSTAYQSIDRQQLYELACERYPHQRDIIISILHQYPTLTDFNILMQLLAGATSSNR